MQAATVDASSGMPMPADMIANNQDDQPENQIADDDVVGEVIIGFDRLRRMFTYRTSRRYREPCRPA